MVSLKEEDVYNKLTNIANGSVIGEKEYPDCTILLYTPDVKKVYLFILCKNVNDKILVYNIVEKLLKELSNPGSKLSDQKKHIKFYTDYFQSIQQPKLIFYTNSIAPKSAIAPENEDIDEIEYYKCKLSNYRYVLRYDGNIKPTFIDPLLNKEFNIFIVCDIIY